MFPGKVRGAWRHSGGDGEQSLWVRSCQCRGWDGGQTCELLSFPQGRGDQTCVLVEEGTPPPPTHLHLQPPIPVQHCCPQESDACLGSLLCRPAGTGLKLRGPEPGVHAPRPQPPRAEPPAPDRRGPPRTCWVQALASSRHHLEQMPGLCPPLRRHLPGGRFRLSIFSVMPWDEFFVLLSQQPSEPIFTHPLCDKLVKHTWFSVIPVQSSQPEGCWPSTHEVAKLPAGVPRPSRVDLQRCRPAHERHKGWGSGEATSRPCKPSTTGGNYQALWNIMGHYGTQGTLRHHETLWDIMGHPGHHGAVHTVGQRGHHGRGGGVCPLMQDRPLTD